MPVSADVQNGDMFVTSGIDGTYPPGLRGRRSHQRARRTRRYVFAKISAKPAAGVDNHRYVMVLPLPAAQRAAARQPKADDAPRKSAQGPRARRRQP